MELIRSLVEAIILCRRMAIYGRRSACGYLGACGGQKTTRSR